MLRGLVVSYKALRQGQNERRGEHTPGVGLMITVGGNLELALPPLGLEAPPEPKRSGALPA